MLSGPSKKRVRAGGTSGGALSVAAARGLVQLANDGELPEGVTLPGVVRMAAKAALDSGGPAVVELSSEAIALYSVEEREDERAGVVPEWIELIPAPRDEAEDGHVETRDWRQGFKVDPQEVVDAFYAVPENRRAIPIDWEHKGHRNWSADRNPAAGWVEDLEARGEAVWGRVRWTDLGHRDVVRTEEHPPRYRYISPVVAIQWPLDSEGNIDWDAIPRATKLIDAALTNNPATYIRDLAMTPGEGEDASENSNRGADALAASHAPPVIPARGRDQDLDGDDDMKLSKQVLTALGLSMEATPEQVEAAILANAAESESPHTAEGASDDARFAELEARVSAKFSEQLAERDAEIEKLKADKESSDSKVLSAQIDLVLSDMAREFRFAPAEREDLIELGKTVGPDKLRELLSKRPSLESLHQGAGKGQWGSSEKPLALTAEERRLADKLGLTHEEAQANKKIMLEGGRFEGGVALMGVAADEDEAA